jgi:tRNA-guanine family transglycosylase
MMDSGGFLFQSRAAVTVKPERICELYDAARIDIGVALDHPLNPMLSPRQNALRWKRTLQNTEKMACQEGSYGFMPVVHGYTLRLLRTACKDIRSVVVRPTLLGIGSLVPLVKASYLGTGFSYRKTDGGIGNHIAFIKDALALVRDEFPESFIHVFGVGGTTTILSMFALGADSVDSVAWRLKAAYGAVQFPGTSDRFLAPRVESVKTRCLLKRNEIPLLAKCRCPVCSQYDTFGWRRRHLDGSFKARTIHNAWVFLREVAAFRAAVTSKRTSVFLAKRLSSTHRFYSVVTDKGEGNGQPV